VNKVNWAVEVKFHETLFLEMM